MQSRAGVTAESLVELKDALKLIVSESAAGEPYAEEVQFERLCGQPLVVGDYMLGFRQRQFSTLEDSSEYRFLVANAVVRSVSY